MPRPEIASRIAASSEALHATNAAVNRVLQEVDSNFETIDAKLDAGSQKLQKDINADARRQSVAIRANSKRIDVERALQRQLRGET